jgi:hypothetical protein
MSAVPTREVLSDGVKTGTQRAQWRYEAGNAIGIIGLVIGVFVIVLSPALGVLLLVGSVGFGLWLAYRS